MSVDWIKVAKVLERQAGTSPKGRGGEALLDEGQRASLTELARRIRAGRRMALIADEVGMGKTRIAVALIQAVREAGGRIAIVIPPGVGVQWQKELSAFDPEDRTLLPLRSFDTFLDSFLNEGDEEWQRYTGSAQDRLHQKRNDRKLQRELPMGLLQDEEILMISHNFANARFPEGDTPRRGLLGEIQHYLGRGNPERRLYNGYHAAMVRAATVIADTVKSNRDVLNFERIMRPENLAAAEYGEKLRPFIGYGLGPFDLVIVDEAHKARKHDSSLSRILREILWTTPDPLRIGMTATPVELGVMQWKGTLSRIAPAPMDLSHMDAPLNAYKEVLERLQREDLDEDLVKAFETAAGDFQKVLAPYVLRRDKRDDPEFAEVIDTYRELDIRRVAPENSDVTFSRDWLRWFAALEALSFLPCRPGENPMKLMRTRLPHGLGTDMFDAALKGETSANQVVVGTAAVWLEALAAGNGEEIDLHDLPSITETVRLIEGYTARGEKVLVFGRFTAALQALTRLLDAREMLRRLSDPDGHWPASALSKDKNARDAIRIAMQDPMLWSGSRDLDVLESQLKEQYDIRAGRREQAMKALRQEVEAEAKAGNRDAALLRSLWNAEGISIAALLEALEAHHPSRNETRAGLSATEVLDAFADLRADLTDASPDEDENQVEAKPEKLEALVRGHLKEYTGREGNFARLMNGSSSPQTRRTLQAAFNRPGAWPMALVTQSKVGSEGLNLHEACSTVVLFQSEWNPGIVEQQIGRVDRKNSLWLNRFRSWKSNGNVGNMPRIMIHPVVISGTYDEHNWSVLETRWQQLGGQLSGNVLPPRSEGASLLNNVRDWENRIRVAIPRFSPDKLLP
ncbi:helicase [Pseudooceanicola sp. CBS1P-1]|uniref:Helicase n=1 Tax=Pseudooceanicola albus TaxID=2692189 RepID=A0A6L7GAH4_9RHOB|nr:MULTISPECIES: DEAD/DEAH box helicase [Pseudooceanicola]MBT9386905.1 helicase [Pseudooceanicola endophyticus]MXN21041.1 helicase [Pseudooceanicola albus]